MRIRDQIGHEVVFTGKTEFPQRIISLVPSQTELLVDLGCEDLIVGCTRFCTHPKHLRRTKKIVGGTKELDFDLILQLNPDFVICNKEENNKEDVLKLQKLFPTYTSDVISLDDSLKMISDLAIITDSEKTGNELISSIEKDFSKMKGLFKGTVAYVIWNDPIMVASKNTFINSILEFVGFENIVVNESNRYPIIDDLELNPENIDFIFLSSEPYPFKDKNRIQFQKKHPNSKVVLVDGRMFSWYGSCLSSVFEYFNALNKQLF